jgi:hypothetical protein
MNLPAIITMCSAVITIMKNAFLEAFPESSILYVLNPGGYYWPTSMQGRTPSI